MQESGKIDQQGIESEKRIPLFVKEGFWDRLIKTPQTTSQKAFDFLFGVVLVIACAIQGGDYITLLSNSVAWFQHFILLETICMIVWLFLDRSLRQFSIILSGVFTFGAIVSCLFSILVVPISITGIVSLIMEPGKSFGMIPLWQMLLGFTPLVTAFVYMRNTIRSWSVSGEYGNLVYWSPLSLVGFIMPIVVIIMTILLYD